MTLDQPTDAQLIARVLQDGNKHAFSDLVRRYQSPLRWWLRKLTSGDSAFADDLAQEAFVKAYMHIQDFRGDARFSTWLYKIAYHVFLAEKRKSFRQNQKMMSVREQEESRSSSPVANLDVQKALSELDDQERAALVLAYSKDLTHPEIAKVLDCPLGTVKTHILRGKEKLRKRLHAWEGKVEHG